MFVSGVKSALGSPDVDHVQKAASGMIVKMDCATLSQSRGLAAQMIIDEPCKGSEPGALIANVVDCRERLSFRYDY
jgi:hypothetical protein